MKKTSLADLAKKLGVSKTLVSLVLNDKGDENGISKETQKKVFEKAKELKYKPNQFARGLRLGKSATIGLIVADISNPFYASICRSIEDAASKHDYHLIICSSDENESKEKQLIELLIDRRIDGLILASTQKEKSAFQSILDANIPLVLIDRNIESLKTNKVLVDNYESAKDAVELLINNGRKHIAMLSISPVDLSPIKERKRGYTDAHEANNLSVENNNIRSIEFNSLKESVEIELKSLISEGIDALFISNNKLAVEVISYLKKKDIAIPKDIAIISFDDRETFELIDPPITAIAQPRKLIGEKAVELLMEKINDENSKEKEIILTTELRIRKSCESKL